MAVTRNQGPEDYDPDERDCRLADAIEGLREALEHMRCEQPDEPEEDPPPDS